MRFLRSNYLQTFFILGILCVALFSWFSLELLPSPKSIDAEENVFSAERALVHVKNIASKPRPLGSSALEISKNYILSQLDQLGCQTSIEKTMAVTSWNGIIYTAPVQNIICVIHGRSKEALMLMSHYDSVHNSPGAADSAAGTSILLETARAIKTSSYKNTLVLLFTDGEENGLKGASAFVREELEKKFDIKMLMNFEARGNSGPLALFETFHFNSLTSLGMKTVARPIGNSFMDFLYQFLPNNTDVSIFKESKIPALNFAFARGLEHYHHSSDTPENLSLSSIQHAGNTALTLSKYFLETNLNAVQSSSSQTLYQDVMGLAHVSYPPSLIKVLSIALIFIGIFCFWVWSIGPLKIIFSFLLCTLFLLANLASAYFFRKLAVDIWGSDQVIIHFYSYFFAYALSVLSLLHFLYLKTKHRFPQLTFGILSLFILSFVSLQYFPELGTLFVWASLGVFIFKIRPTPFWQNMALLPIAIIIPELLHTSLIADSGTQFVLPTLILCFGLALLHLLFFNPHIKKSTVTHQSIEVVKPNAHPVLHGFSFAVGCFILVILHFTSQKTFQSRAEFFEIATDDSLYVALGANTPTPDLLKSTEVDSIKKEFLMWGLTPFWIDPDHFKVFKTNAEIPKAPHVDFSLWENAKVDSQYLLDIPAQDFDCVNVYLLPFEGLKDLKVNALDPFPIPNKKFSKATAPYLVQSCDLRRTPLRIEFKMPLGRILSRESVAIFTRSTQAPDELNLNKSSIIWGRSSNMLYVLKKIML